MGETKMDGRNERKEKKKTNDISETLPTLTRRTTAWVPGKLHGKVHRTTLGSWRNLVIPGPCGDGITFRPQSFLRFNNQDNGRRHKWQSFLEALLTGVPDVEFHLQEDI